MMSTPRAKTKAEQDLENAFTTIAPKLPGSDAVMGARKKALAVFGDLGLPHRRIEEWKYTDVRGAVSDALPLILDDEKHNLSAGDLKQALGELGTLDAYFVIFIDGAYSKDLSNLAGADDLSIKSLREQLTTDATAAETLSNAPIVADADAGTRSVLALNAAYATDGCLVDVAPGSNIDKPVVVANLRANTQPGWTATRGHIHVGDNAHVTLVEVFGALNSAPSTGQSNAANNITLEKGANLKHIKVLTDTVGVTHLSDAAINLGSDTTYEGFQFTQGPGLVRNQLQATYSGEGATFDLSGVFLARGREHIDTTIIVDHAVPSCLSRELFKGVLDDHARGVVQGKVIVRPDAQQTDGKQMAQALMLSPDTEFDSKPELEIYADDVVCGHGSTVAQLDHDLLFYCRSRGIPEPKARELLVQSFIGEALAKVDNDAIRAYLSGIVGTWIKQRES